MGTLNYAIENSVVNMYVKTLYNVAKQNNISDVIYKQIISLQELLTSINNHDKLISNMNLEKKKGFMFLSILEKELGYKEEFCNFLKVLIVNKRFNIILNICTAYKNYLSSLNGEKNILITTYKKATDIEQTQILEMLQQNFGKHIQLEFSINPDLLGGFKVQHKSKILDYTLKSQISRLRCSIKTNNHEQRTQS